MKLTSLLQPKLIKCGLAATSKDEALRELVQLVTAAHPELSEVDVLQALNEREKQGPFSMGKGVAIPHARTEKVLDFQVAIGTAPAGIDFKAPDGNKVRVVVLFVIPKKHSNLYLHALAQFLDLFAVESQALKIIEAKSPSELIAVMESAAGGGAGAGIVREAALHGLPPVTRSTTLSKVVELLLQNRTEVLPVVDAEGNLIGEITTAAILKLGARDHLLSLSSPSLARTSDPFEGLLRHHGESTLESIPGLVAANGFKTVQEDEPLLDVVLRLTHAGVRSAYVLRGRKVAGIVTLNDLLKKVTARKA